MNEFLKKHYQILSAVIILICVGNAVFWGMQKQGYYIDEYYTYTLSNGTGLGISIQTNQWNQTDSYFHELVSEGNENFHFSQTYVNNENDVHPPLYYFLIHFLSSVFSGVFSKWIGIGANIFILIPCMYFVRQIAYLLSGKIEWKALLVLLFYGLSPATVSGITFIRMYFLFSLFVLIYIYIHLLDMKRDDSISLKFLVPVFVTGFLGFLTHYYFVIAMFFITFFYCLYLLIYKRNWKRIICYGMSALLSLIMTYFVWPVSVFHIFKGYRGKGAAEDLMSVDGVLNRAKLFLGNLNNNVFSGLLLVFCIGVVFWLVFHKRESSLEGKGKLLCFLSSFCYFVVVAKIALTAGDSSNRYEFPIYGIVLILVALQCMDFFSCFVKNKSTGRIFAVLALILIVCLGYARNQVLYLYPEEATGMQYAKEHQDSTVIMFQKDDGMYDTRIGELMQYDEVYYASLDETKTIEDPRLQESSEIIAYIDKKADPTETFQRLTPGNETFQEEKLLWSCNLSFDVYLLKR